MKSMKGSERGIRSFLIDKNVFIAAIKNPRGGTLSLLLRIINEEKIALVGNDLLVEEFLLYAERFRSKTALALITAMLDKMQIIEIKENYLKACKPYILTPKKTDILNAAACLQSDAILITNDKYFDRIKKAGIIEVWNTGEAIEKLK